MERIFLNRNEFDSSCLLALILNQFWFSKTHEHASEICLTNFHKEWNYVRNTRAGFFQNTGMNAMDLDEIPCGSSKEERNSHAAKKVLKIGHRQKLILATFTCYHEMINHLLLQRKVRPPKIMKQYYNAITMAHSNMIDECEQVLILQGKKNTYDTCGVITPSFKTI